MFIAGKEYKIRSVLQYRETPVTFGNTVFEDCLFDTFFGCLDHLLDIRETIRENDLDGFLCIVGVERRRPTPDFCTSSHIVSELNRDWYTDDWFDANEDDMDYVSETEDEDCRTFYMYVADHLGCTLEDMPEFGEIVLDGIKLVVKLEVFDAEDDLLFADDFMSFTAVNEFLDANADEFKDCSIRFYLCEYVDGQTGADGAYWEKDYGRIGMRDICCAVDEEAADIFRQKFRHIRPEKPVLYRGRSGYTDTPVGEDQTLVCDACYYPIDECTCEEKGLGAVPIDTRYVPIIRELNKKGYCTKFCCAGHEKQYATRYFSPDIMFKYENDFAVPLPEEYVYFRKNCEIRLRSDLHLPDGSDIEAARAFHDRITDDLAEWVHKLPAVAKIRYRGLLNTFIK